MAQENALVSKQFLQERATVVRSALQQSAAGMIQAGQALLDVKARLNHGEFLAWLERDCQLNRRTASRLMLVAKTFGGKVDTVSHLRPTQLYLLASGKTLESGSSSGSYGGSSSESRASKLTAGEIIAALKNNSDLQCEVLAQYGLDAELCLCYAIDGATKSLDFNWWVESCQEDQQLPPKIKAAADFFTRVLQSAGKAAIR